MSPPVSLFWLAPLLAGVTPDGSSFSPPIAEDHDPAPEVVEVHLTAEVTSWEFTPGAETLVYAFDGMVPGPTIRARVGDRVRVVVENRLPEPTSFTHQGLVVGPGSEEDAPLGRLLPGETADFEFTVGRAQLAWYHPRTLGELPGAALYGAILVEDPVQDTRLGLEGLRQEILILDDVGLAGYDPFTRFATAHDPLGDQEGELLLLNGREAARALLELERGQPVRLRFLNACATRFAWLDLLDPVHGLDVPIFRLGSDRGPDPRPTRVDPVRPEAATDPVRGLLSEMDGILLLPGERRDVVFTPRGDPEAVFGVFQYEWPGTRRGDSDPAGDRRAAEARRVAPQRVLALRVNGDDPVERGYRPAPGEGELERVNHRGGTRELAPVTLLASDPEPESARVGLLARFDEHGEVEVPGEPRALVPWRVNGADRFMLSLCNATSRDLVLQSEGFGFEVIDVELFDPDHGAEVYVHRPELGRTVRDVVRLPARPGPAQGSASTTRLLVSPRTTRAVQNLRQRLELTLAQRAPGVLVARLRPESAHERFTRVGGANLGRMGLLQLKAYGTLEETSELSLRVENARPGRDVWIVAGNIEVKQPFGSGAIVPGHSRDGRRPVRAPRVTLRLRAQADEDGVATVSTRAWKRAEPGQTLYWQALQPDEIAAEGWALSDAIAFTRP